MKTTKRKWNKGALLCVLLCAAAVLTGCGKVDAASGESADGAAASAAETDYPARVRELEAELEKRREEEYVTRTQFTARITELEAELARLQSTEPAPAVGAGAVYTYELRDGEAVITAYTGTETMLYLPAALDGYPVTAIGERAFERTAVHAVVVPESVRGIGWFAFYGCASLRDVTLTAGVTEIGYGAFEGCAGVTICCPAGSYASAWAESYGISRINV